MAVTKTTIRTEYYAPARHIAEWRRERRTVFVYFDNDQKSAAPTDARRLVEILQRTGRK